MQRMSHSMESMVGRIVQANSSFIIPADVFIYSIVSVGSQHSPNVFAIIASDDSLRLIQHTQTEYLTQIACAENAHEGITCLTKAGNEILTCGRDGLVKVWDNSLTQTGQFKTRKRHQNTIALRARANTKAAQPQSCLYRRWQPMKKPSLSLPE
jgi:WD40 repeat protein